MKRLRLGVLASGGGTNLQSILDRSQEGSLPATVVVVISNNSSAGALERAQRHGVETLHISATTEGSTAAADQRIADELAARNVDLIVLAGYMKKIGRPVLQGFAGKIINIHPALLPNYGGAGMYGIHVHRAVVEAGDRESGATVHFVDDRYDHGSIIEQIRVPVYPNDTPETLQKRVLAQEHELYPRVIRMFAENWEVTWKERGGNKPTN